MIKLKSKIYYIENSEIKELWDKLDKIICGQHLNPETSYTTKH
jgi:hypothetical protein